MTCGAFRRHYLLRKPLDWNVVFSLVSTNFILPNAAIETI